MRKTLLIGLIAATALSTPAVARPHDRHHGDRHHYDRHDRDRHRHHVRYVSPYRGWSYRRVSTGYRLRPAFYSPRYAISDYDYYRVRSPARYHRWIRYGPDLLLVDIRNGRVLRVIPGRFY